MCRKVETILSAWIRDFNRARTSDRCRAPLAIAVKGKSPQSTAFRPRSGRINLPISTVTIAGPNGALWVSFLHALDTTYVETRRIEPVRIETTSLLLILVALSLGTGCDNDPLGLEGPGGLYPTTADFTPLPPTDSDGNRTIDMSASYAHVSSTRSEIYVEVTGLAVGERSEIRLRKGTENGPLVGEETTRADSDGKASVTFGISTTGPYTIEGFFGNQDPETLTVKITVR